MLGVEGWDGEDTVGDCAVYAKGFGDVSGVGEDHGDEFFWCEWFAVDGEAYSTTGGVVVWCDWVVAFRHDLGVWKEE